MFSLYMSGHIFSSTMGNAEVRCTISTPYVCVKCSVSMNDVDGIELFILTSSNTPYEQDI